MSTIPSAVVKSLPPMEQGAPMMDQGVHPDGALAEAAKKIAAATQQIVEQIPVVLRSGEESKRRAVLKAVDLLTSEFPPEAGAQEGGVSDAVMKSLQSGATDQSQQQPPPGAGTGMPAGMPPPDMSAAMQAQPGAD